MSQLAEHTTTSNILVVDDDPSIQLIIKQSLSQLGNILTASTGEEAINLAKKIQPEVILLDIELPGISGFEVCRKIKADPLTRNIAIIFITSHGHEDFEKLSLSIGGIDFLAKPINVVTCKLRVQNHLQIKLSEKLIQEFHENLISENEGFKLTLKSVGDAVIATDVNANISFMNPIAERMTGWHNYEAQGMHIDEIMNLTDATTLASIDNPLQFAIKHNSVTVKAKNSQLTSKDGTIFRIEDTAAPIRNDHGDVIGGIIVFHDISETVEMSLKMTHLANHDFLTDLPNRSLLHDRLERGLKIAEAACTKVAFILLDLDHFKHLNETLSHKIGDELLKKIARRLNRAINAKSTLARIGGDEFAIVSHDFQSINQVVSEVNHLQSQFKDSFVWDNNSFNITASIGISIYPDDATSIDEVLSHADVAMYRAKQEGRDRYCFFSTDLEKNLHERRNVETALRSHLKFNTLEIHYQPKITLATNKISGIEALVRMADVDGSIIPPDKFIHIAEESGLIVQLGEQVLKKACKQAAAWQTKFPDLEVAINIAAAQIIHPEFVDSLRDILNHTRLDPGLVKLEVTESTLISDIPQCQKAIEALHELGVSISLDDFGTGYSSLVYLKKFQIDEIKIDKSFIADMESDRNDYDIIKAIISLAKSIDVNVVAEGVSHEAQESMLKELGCNTVQGFLYSKPLEYLACEHVLKKYSS